MNNFIENATLGQNEASTFASNELREDTYSQVLPIFTWSGEFLGYAFRGDIHNKGFIHAKVEANIIRPNEQGTFDILVQERSHDGSIDIGKGKYDQSMASHVRKQDFLSPERTLSRGLQAELSIKNYYSYRLPTTFLISKKYGDSYGAEQNGIINNERSTLYLVRQSSSKDEIFSSSSKVQSVTWMEWNQFLTFFQEHKKAFTLTSRFYFDTPVLRAYIEEKSLEFLGMQTASNTYNDVSKVENHIFLHIHHGDNLAKTVMIPKAELSALDSLE